MPSRHQHRAMEQQFKDVPSVARTAMVIAAALIFGELVFAGIVLLTGWGQPPGDIVVPIVMLALAVMELPILLVVAPTITKNNVRAAYALDSFRDRPEVSLATVYLTRMIIVFALLEGACFGNLIGFMVGHHVWSLAVAGCLMFGQLVIFPSRNRIDNWIEDQKRKYERGEIEMHH
ncbi:MAG: hypothetical protein O3A00_00985 [Planctomycetota bacterium]|nr:hypothetical protein [Planctomycetota bacterium]